jgi:hypothetical protein
MSETYAPAANPEGVEHEAPAEESQTETGGEGQSSEEGEGRARSVDWEKQARDKAGLAANERVKRRAAERELGDLKRQVDELSARVTGSDRDELLEMVAGLRDDDDEPITDINRVKAIIKTFITREQKTAEAQTAEQKRSAYVNNLTRQMDSAEKDFAVEHPDYPEAAVWYAKERQAEFEALGYHGAALKSRMANELYGMTDRLLQEGRDPAEAIYALAKRRGFKAGMQHQDEELQKIQKAATASAGSRGAARPEAGRLTYESVNKLSGAAFDTAYAKLRKQELGLH